MAKIVNFERLPHELRRLGIERTPDQLGPLATGSAMSWLRSDVSVVDYQTNRLIPIVVDVIASQPVVQLTRRCVIELLNRYSSQSIDDRSQTVSVGEAGLVHAQAVAVPSEVLRSNIGALFTRRGQIQRALLGMPWCWRPGNDSYGLLQGSMEPVKILSQTRQLCSSDLRDFVVVPGDSNRFLVAQRPI